MSKEERHTLARKCLADFYRENPERRKLAMTFKKMARAYGLKCQEFWIKVLRSQ